MKKAKILLLVLLFFPLLSFAHQNVSTVLLNGYFVESPEDAELGRVALSYDVKSTSSSLESPENYQTSKVFFSENNGAAEEKKIYLKEHVLYVRNNSKDIPVADVIEINATFYHNVQTTVDMKDSKSYQLHINIDETD